MISYDLHLTWIQLLPCMSLERNNMVVWCRLTTRVCELMSDDLGIVQKIKINALEDGKQQRNATIY